MSNPAQILLDTKINLNLIKFVYPEAVTTIKKYTQSSHELELHLIQLGERVGKYVGGIWNRNYQGIDKLMKEIAMMSGGTKIKIKRNSNTFSITDENCFVCWKILEITDIHYCSIISGFINGFFEVLLSRIKTPIQKVEAKTITSVSSGGPFCQHEIQLRY